MFSVTIKGVRWGAAFSFFAVTALVCLYDGIDLCKLAVVLSCCMFHELGHLFFMILFGRKPKSVILYGGGIRITPNDERLTADNEDIIILLAGCAVNFTLAVVWLLLAGADFFFGVNLMLGIFNLMPFKYFDGGRVLQKLVSHKAYMIIRLLFFAMGMVCIWLMCKNGFVSISLIVTFAVIGISEFVW